MINQQLGGTLESGMKIDIAARHGNDKGTRPLLLCKKSSHLHSRLKIILDTAVLAKLAALLYLCRQCMKATREIEVAELAIRQRVRGYQTCLLWQIHMQHGQLDGYLAYSKGCLGEEKVDNV